MSSEHNVVRKNLFLSACFFWDSRLSSPEMDQKKFGGKIGFGDSYVELLIRHFKVFRLYAILHGVAGTVRAHSGNGPGYCYMIGRGPNSCLLGHLNGLLLPFRKTLSAVHFHVCPHLKQNVLHCSRN